MAASGSGTDGAGCPLQNELVDDLSSRFDLPIIGQQGIDLVNVPDTGWIDFGNVVPKFHINTNTSGPICSIPGIVYDIIAFCALPYGNDSGFDAGCD